jgi:hypothetical protein
MEEHRLSAKGKALRRWFYLKWGYGQYFALALGFVGNFSSILLVLTLLLGISTPEAVAGSLALGLPIAYATARLGRWDMKGGMKRVIALLHYANDPYVKEQTKATLAIMEALKLPEAEGYRKAMEKWGMLE